MFRFGSKSLKMAWKAFEAAHPDLHLSYLKEHRSEYEERCAAEKTGRTVFITLVYVVDWDAKDLDEGFAIYRVDHSTGEAHEVAVGIDSDEVATRRIQDELERSKRATSESSLD